MRTRTLLGLGAAILIATSSPVTAVRADDEAGDRAAPTVTENRININTATETELVRLKGIGHGVAKRIIEYRQTHGDFKRPEDIRKVSGVGRVLWEQNRDRIAVK